MKRVYLWLAVVIAIFLGTYLLLRFAPREYTIVRGSGMPQVLSNGREAFIVIAQHESVNSQMKLLRKLHLSPLFLLLLSDRGFESSNKVFHYEHGRLDEVQFPGRYGTWTVFSDSLAFTGALYRSRKETDWRWNGTAFIELSAQDSAKLRAALGNRDPEELLEDGGWQLQFVVPKGRTARHLVKVPVAEGELSVLVAHPPVQPNDEEGVNAYIGAAGVQVSVSGAGLAGMRELSDGLATKPVATTREEFERVAGVQEGAARTAWTLAEVAGSLLLWTLPFWIVIARMVRIKSKILANMADNISYLPAAPEQFPWLDRNRFTELGQRLESRGFTRLMEFTVIRDRGTVAPCFAVLYFHAGEKCFAEVHQIMVPGKKPLDAAANLSTRFDSGWKLATNSRRPNGANYLLRRPNAVWKSLPGADIDAVWAAHGEWRQQMMLDLGIKPRGEGSAAWYFEAAKNLTAELKQSIRRKNVFILLFEYYTFRWRGITEWRGDWPKAAKERQPAAMGAAAN